MKIKKVKPVTERLDERKAILDQLETLRSLNPEITKQYNLSSSASELLNAIDTARHERNLGREGSAEWTANQGLKLQQQQANQNAYQFQVQQQQQASEQRSIADADRRTA